MPKRVNGRIYEITILKHNRAFPVDFLKVQVIDSGIREVKIKYSVYPNVKLRILNEVGQSISIGDAPYIKSKILATKAEITNLKLITKDIQFSEKQTKKRAFKEGVKQKWTFLNDEGAPINTATEILIDLYTISYDTLIDPENKYDTLKKRFESRQQLKENKVRELEELLDDLVNETSLELKKERNYWRERMDGLKETIKDLKRRLDLKETEIINVLAQQAYETLNDLAELESIPEEKFSSSES